MTSGNWSDRSSMLIRLLLTAAGTMAFLLPALINGYPLVYSDTSTYIASGFTLEPPLDRPIMYGLFLRFTSMNGVTLWTVVIAQGVLLSMLLFRIYSLLTGVRDRKWKAIGFLLLVMLSSLAGAGWATSHLMPDIFTAIMVFSVLLIVLQDGDPRSKVHLYILFGISVSVHFSHVPLSLALLLLLFLVWLYNHRRENDPFRLRILAILLGITLLGFGSMASSYSKSRHVFLMGAFVEQGIIGEFLNENCEENRYGLCNYKDTLPAYSWQFIWEPYSPLYQLGGWKETRDEFNEIIRKTFTSPKYLWMHVKASARETSRQIIRFRTVEPFGVAPNSEQLRSRVHHYIPSDGKRYDRAIQNRTDLMALVWLNPVQLVLVFLSLAIFTGLIFDKELRKHQKIKFTVLILFAGLFLNAFISATFGNAIDRMGNKMIWILPMMILILLINTIRNHSRE